MTAVRWVPEVDEERRGLILLSDSLLFYWWT